MSLPTTIVLYVYMTFYMVSSSNPDISRMLIFNHPNSGRNLLEISSSDDMSTTAAATTTTASTTAAVTTASATTTAAATTTTAASTTAATTALESESDSSEFNITSVFETNMTASESESSESNITSVFESESSDESNITSVTPGVTTASESASSELILESASSESESEESAESIPAVMDALTEGAISVCADALADGDLELDSGLSGSGSVEVDIDSIDDLSEEQKQAFLDQCEFSCEFELIGLVDGWEELTECDCTLFECKTGSNGYRWRVIIAFVFVFSVFTVM